MRVAFAGTPAFAAAALERLHAAGFEMPLVLTQPDRPAGRGLKLQPSAVKMAAVAHGLPVLQARSLKLDGHFAGDAAAARKALQAAQPDVLVVAAYGLILPPWTLALPRLGCLNIHASLLPRWRGAAPIHRAIEAGDRRTGITIMQMDAGLDTGDVLLAEPLDITADDTTGTLHERLAELGARSIVEALDAVARGQLRAAPQPADGASYAHKIGKAETVIDWTQPAAVIERRIRAFDPSPGASTRLDGAPLKVWRAHVVDRPPPASAASPGSVVAEGDEAIVVACGGGALALTELQRAGGRRVSARQFRQGQPPLAGRLLGDG